MNLSRAYSLAYSEELSVGRVQTPTLAMLVERELAIRKFLTQLPTRFEPATGDVKLHGVHLDVDETTGRCRHIERVAMDLDSTPGSGGS